mgnify:CR=1 FL=1
MDKTNNLNKKDELGEILQDVNAVQKHIINIIGLSCINLSQIRKKKFTVVLDAVNGAGYDAVPQLLETLNCEVIRINCDPSGDFVRGPEPLANNLEMLSDTVKKTNADIKIYFTKDGFRTQTNPNNIVHAQSVCTSHC